MCWCFNDYLCFLLLLEDFIFAMYYSDFIVVFYCFYWSNVLLNLYYDLINAIMWFYITDSIFKLFHYSYFTPHIKMESQNINIPGNKKIYSKYT